MLIQIKSNKPINEWLHDGNNIHQDIPGTSGQFRCTAGCYTLGGDGAGEWEYTLEEILPPEVLPDLNPQRLAWLENWCRCTDERDVAKTVQALLEGYRTVMLPRKMPNPLTLQGHVNLNIWLNGSGGVRNPYIREKVQRLLECFE